MLKLTDFVPKAYQLYTRMMRQGENKGSVLCQIKKKAFQRHPETFSSIARHIDELIKEIIMS